MNCRYSRRAVLWGILLLFGGIVSADMDLALFGSDAIVNSPEVVDCTLNTGASAQCAKLIVKYKPDNREIGPFCPETIDDVGGIWSWDGEGKGLYRLDRAFFDMLSKLGVALDGVPIFADAPSVLQTGHLPALDTCGGHIDPGGWYHWHATATDIDDVFEHNHVDAECTLAQSASAQFGYAFDGYAMYGSEDSDGSVPDSLDACNGHVGATDAAEEGEYHYHSTSQFPNLPACLSGVLAQDNFNTTASRGIGSTGGRAAGGPFVEGQGMPGLEEAADTLGVRTEDLMQAIQEAGGAGPQLDIDEVASALGVLSDALTAALPRPPKR